jgi:hypothetical protein
MGAAGGVCSRLGIGSGVATLFTTKHPVWQSLRRRRPAGIPPQNNYLIWLVIKKI